MYRRLLVPLDGSGLAECVLPAVRFLARRLGASVMLLHVLEREAPAEVHGDRHLCDPLDAAAYVGRVVSSLAAEGIEVWSHVHLEATDDVARSIAEHGREYGCDLTMLTTHGSGGTREWLFGSIAQQVLGSGTEPVFVVHPERCGPIFDCHRIAVALDGDPAHEASLPVAAALASIFNARLDLVTIVPRRGDLRGERAASALLLPSATAAYLDVQQEELDRYLRATEARMRREGVEVSRHALRGEPAEALAQFMNGAETNLAVIATHARRGWEAFWEGSLAPRILSEWKGASLLVRSPA